MVKHTQTIRRQQPTNCLTVFDHFVKLALKGLIIYLFISLRITTTLKTVKGWIVEALDIEISAN